MCSCHSRPGEVIIRRVEAEADEMHSFVQQRANEQWLWLALDRSHPPDHCLARWRSESYECQAVVGEPSSGIP